VPVTPHPPTRRTAGDCGFVLHDIPAEAAGASDVRHHLTGWLTDNAITTNDERRSDIVLAVYEAVANAAEHAYRTLPVHPGQPRPIAVEALYRRRTRTLEITVSDHGRWRPPLPTHTRGYGLRLIRAVADTTNIHTGPGGTTVTAQWRLFS
jgi:serine/threonine-protein kinase RsbW